MSEDRNDLMPRASGDLLAPMFGRGIADLAKGLYAAGPGTLERVWSGELPPGAPETEEAARQTALAYGSFGGSAPESALRSTLGWHGTGVSFDKFLDEFIGTGEGAQSYGWGHYVAGNPKVAETYQHAASQGGNHLLEINIKPDEHEMLDWDKPIAQQSPQVQSKLKEGGWLDSYEPGDLDHIDGGSLYNDHTDMVYRNRSSMKQLPGQDNWDAAKMSVSKDLHEAGIPGIKFLDQASRNMTQPAVHSGDLSDLQQQGMQILNNSGQASRWESGGPTEELNRLISNFETSSQAKAAGNKYIMPDVDDRLAALRSLDPAKLSGARLTRNYVIFHPDNLEIRSRDGRPLTPVDHDPWAGP